ncbi:MAG: PqqD family peptide modification chaperone [Anaerolineaceae bacterium]|jgi:hypothetical protein
MSFFNRMIARVFVPFKPLPPGVFPYQTPPDAPMQYRLHLRIEPDGEGILVVNAKTVLHLNQTATELIYHLVQKTPEDEAVEQIARRYHVKKDQALQDYRQLIARIQELISTPGIDPETFLDFQRVDPHFKDLSAPLRLDCALTYRVSEQVAKDVAPVERVGRELLTEEWKTVMEKAWNAGIPHVIFTGGEPTLRPDLPDLIAHGQKLGQVTGLLTDGYRLTDTHYFHQLLQSGLDHLMILLEPGEDQSWEAVRDAVVEDIHVTVHLTIDQADATPFIALLDRLSDMGVKEVSLSANDASFAETLHVLSAAAADRRMSLVWDLPVPYSHVHPVALEIAEHEKPPSGAGRAWLYVEPDGDVLPTQGVTTVLGNLLTDPWEKIWHNR